MGQYDNWKRATVTYKDGRVQTFRMWVGGQENPVHDAMNADYWEFTIEPVGADYMVSTLIAKSEVRSIDITSIETWQDWRDTGGSQPGDPEGRGVRGGAPSPGEATARTG